MFLGAATSKFYSPRSVIAIRGDWRIYFPSQSVFENLSGLGFAGNLPLHLLAELQRMRNLRKNFWRATCAA